VQIQCNAGQEGRASRIHTTSGVTHVSCCLSTLSVMPPLLAFIGGTHSSSLTEKAQVGCPSNLALQVSGFASNSEKHTHARPESIPGLPIAASRTSLVSSWQGYGLGFRWLFLHNVHSGATTTAETSARSRCRNLLGDHKTFVSLSGFQSRFYHGQEHCGAALTLKHMCHKT
jgi:hypothetical protein